MSQDIRKTEEYSLLWHDVLQLWRTC
jgi:hypothetical protein